MATIATEPWTATSTTAWPSQWSAGVNQGTVSVASTRGRLTPSGTGYKTIRRLLSGGQTATVARRKMSGTFIMSAITEQYIRISGRESAGTTGAYPTGYFFRVDPASGTWVILGGYGTGEYGAASAVTLAMVANQVYGYTILTEAGTTSASIWNVTAGGTEPGTYQSTWTDTDYGGDVGVPALSQQSGGSTTPYVEFGPVTVTDGTAAASPNGSMMLAF